MIRYTSPSAFFLVLTVALLTAPALRAQEGSSPTYTPEQLHRHFQNIARALQFDAGDERLSLRPQPLMHWQNTVRLQEQGALYMWERKGRPLVLGSIFTFENDGIVRCRHEMISLALTSMTGQLDGTIVWAPKTAGVTWNLIDGVPAPAESPARRLTQMRGIARQFTGTLKLSGQQPSTLELLPQPVVRYQLPDDGVMDGGVFSMAVVTDPEILLVIEAREGKSGPPTWHFAAARSHYEELKLQRNGQLVWKAPAVPQLQDTQAGQLPFASDPYFIYFPSQPLPAPEDLE